jgi:hypothetical protein
MKIRPSTSSDIELLARVADATELFPGEMLPAMIDPFLLSDASQDIWLTYEVRGDAAGFCYAVPEKLTDGTWNMLAIAVHPREQGNGAGCALVSGLEATLIGRGQRILIAERRGRRSWQKRANSIVRKFAIELRHLATRRVFPEPLWLFGRLPDQILACLPRNR